MDGQDFQYRNLIVWQKSMQFSRQVYRLIERFPAAEKYALSDQVRRAVVSVPSNIAEGCGRASNRSLSMSHPIPSTLISATVSSRLPMSPTRN